MKTFYESCADQKCRTNINHPCASARGAVSFLRLGRCGDERVLYSDYKAYQDAKKLSFQFDIDDTGTDDILDTDQGNYPTVMQYCGK